MIINGKRIKSLSSRLHHVKQGEMVVICLSNIEQYRDIMVQVGFSDHFELGERILPSPSFGARSRYNANGDHIIHRDRPMETAYRTIEWCWQEFHGPYERVERSRLVDVPYDRYPRTFVPPPSVEFTIRATTDGQKIITTEDIEYSEENSGEILHRINLFLEIFGSCEVRQSNLENIITCEIRNLNWRILPEGRRPWGQLINDIEPFVNSARKGNQSFIWHRLQTINSYGPDFVAIGQGGFHGYLIFAFPDKSIYVLESMYVGNATYFLGDDWETVSRLTKAEVLSQDRHQCRVIHSANWERNIAKKI